MPTYGHWEHDVLERCFDKVDFISLHQYFCNDANDIASYFSVLDDLDSFIKVVAAIAARRVQAALEIAHLTRCSQRRRKASIVPPRQAPLGACFVGGLPGGRDRRYGRAACDISSTPS